MVYIRADVFFIFSVLPEIDEKEISTGRNSRLLKESSFFFSFFFFLFSSRQLAELNEVRSI
jgi:hypothetical protein